MKDFEIKQWLYNKSHIHSDEISQIEFSENHDKDAIISFASNYLSTEVNKVEFPGKSYAVAIIYSYLLEKNFGVPFFESLNNKNLFVGNDKYFVVYEEDPSTYDAILARIKNIEAAFEFSQVKKTWEYFQAEFSLREPGPTPS